MITFLTYTAAQPLLAVEWGLSSAQAGAIFAAQQAGYTLAVVLLSSLTDLVGVRRVYLLSAVWNSVAGVLFALGARSFASAAALRALIGIGLAGTYTPGMRLVAEAFPATRRGAALGVYIACFSVGAALSLFIGGRLLIFGPRTMLLLTSLGPLLGVVIGWWVVTDPPERARREIRRLPFRAALTSARAMRYIGAYAAHSYELFGMRAWLPIFLAAVWVADGASTAEAVRRATAVGSAVLLSGAFSNAAGGWVSDRWGRSRTIAIFLGASAVCSASVGWLLPADVAVVVPVIFLYGLLVMADSSALSTAVAESAAPDALGTTMAVQSSLGFMAAMISPVLFGAVLDRAGWGWAFLSLGAAAIPGIALLVAGRRL